LRQLRFIMRRYWIILFLLGLFPWATTAQSLQGYVLVRTAEIGASQNPDRLFLVDVAAGRMSEILVQNESFYAPWFGWSPDGSSFAYLTSARSGPYNELCVNSANRSNPRTPLFDLNLPTLSADGNSVYNIFAVSVAGAQTQNGIY